jgi:hypothetical protein
MVALFLSSNQSQVFTISHLNFFFLLYAADLIYFFNNYILGLLKMVPAVCELVTAVVQLIILLMLG